MLVVLDGKEWKTPLEKTWMPFGGLMDGDGVTLRMVR